MDSSINNLVDMMLSNMRLNEVMIESFNEPKTKYKKVISAVGLANLRKVEYDNIKIEQQCKKCAITMEDFEKGEKVIQLPCKHIFKEEGIMSWLTDNSATCPVCRYELPYREEKVAPPPPLSSPLSPPPSLPPSLLISSTETFYEPSIPLIQTTNRNFITGIMDRLLEIEEEENIRLAIEASLN